MNGKKPPGINPEDQSRLDAMGTERVLADLAKKYQPITGAPDDTKPLPSPSSNLSPEDKARLDATGILAIMEQLAQKRKELIQELEQLPRHRETYQKQELEAILKVKKRLRVFIEDFDQAARDFSEGSPEYNALCEKYIEQVTQYLDQENFWHYKFTTENSGGASSDTPLTYSADDSVYYATHSGISLRLKRSASDRGLGTVIQPFYEKIIFGLPDSQLSEAMPVIGGQVIEYRCDEFRELLDHDRISEDFESPNEIYTKDGRIRFVASNDQKPHEGDRVNRILETR